MFHAEISGSTEREGSDARVGTKEVLVIAVVAYAVSARRVVIDQTEVVGRVREYFGQLAKVV